MNTVWLTDSMFTFRIRLANGREVDLDHHGSGAKNYCIIRDFFKAQGETKTVYVHFCW